MQILTVELENVKSYERAQVTFSQGVNAIVGQNGAGKSTILEAIGFTLFDALDYNQTEFVRGGAKSARMRVSFVSSADERAYDVERRIGTSARYAVHDPQLGAVICEGKADVLRFLRQHLQVEPNADLASIFKDAVGVPQGTLTAAFLLNEANRKRIFEALLRVEEYSSVWEKLREPLNVLKARKGDVAIEISRLQGQLQRLPELEAEIAGRKQEIATKQRDLETATQELESVQARFAKLEAEHEQVKQDENALAEAKTKHENARKRYLDAEQRRVEAEAAKAMVTANRAGHDEYVQAQSTRDEIDKLVRQRQQIEAKRADVATRVARYEVQARQSEIDLENVAAAEKTVLALHGSVVEWTRLDGELAKARQQQARLDDAKRAVTQQQEQLERAQAHRADLEQKLGEAQTVEDKIQAATRQSEESSKKLDSERETLSRLKSQADLIKEHSQKLADVQSAVCPVCEQPLTPTHRSEMLARNDKQLEAMRVHYRDASNQVQTLKEELQQEQDTLKQWQAALLKLPRADEATKAQEEVARVQKHLDQALSQVSMLADAAQQVETISKVLAALGDPRAEYNVANDRAKRRKEVEEQLAQTKVKLASAQEEIAKLQVELAGFGDLDAQVDAVVAIVLKNEKAHQAVLGNQRLADELPRLAQSAAELAHEAEEFSTIYADRENAFRRAAANFDKNAYTQADNRYQELLRAVGTLTGERDSLAASQDKSARELSDLQGLTVVVAEKDTRMKQLVDEEDVLTTIRDKLRQAGPYISSALNRQISDGARQIFSDLMQDYSRHLTWNEDYSISLEVDGRERSFSQLSGGEQMSAALSVRLALLREMSSIDIAFFDEPTANLDEVRRESLARQILNVRGFRQIFVISHDDTFEQATQNLIRVERVAGTSRIVPS